jgi:tetratricopeptide (TPR) repeat protein
LSIYSLKYYLISVTTSIADAQQDVKLPGVVVEQNSKIKTGAVIYLQGAGIKATKATPQSSDANGRFTLIFGDMPPGNVTHIDVVKDGYEVVNTKVLQSAAITGRTAPLEIVMCKSGLLYENQITYYNIATDASRMAYEKKINVLEQGGQNKEALIAHLQKELNKQINSKEEAIQALKEQYQFQVGQSQMLADKFSSVNLDDESETYQKAFAAFQSKNIDQALVLLDSVNLEKRLGINTLALQKEESSATGSLKNIERRKQQMQQDVSECMFKSRLHILKYDYQTAKQNYLLALAYDSLNTDNLWEVSVFLLNQKEDSLAKKYFDKLLLLTPGDNEKALLLTEIGNAYTSSGAYEEAEKYYPAAVKIFNELYEKNPVAYRAALAKTLINFGQLYYDWQYFSIAKNYYDKADDIYTQAYDSLGNPALSDSESLMWYDIMYNQCLLDYKYKNYDAAQRRSYFMSIPLLQKVIQKNPGQYTERLANGLYNEALSYFYLNDYELAADDFTSALDMIRNLYDEDSSRYAVRLGYMLNSEGYLCYELNMYSAAEQFCNEGLKILRDATARNPSDQNLSYLAIGSSHLGQINDKLKNYSKSESCFTEAINIQRQITEINPFKYTADLSETLHAFGKLYYDWNKNTPAQQYYTEALNNYKKLFDKNPEIYIHDLSGLYYDIGLLNIALKKYDDAGQNLTEALKIQTQLIDKEKATASDEKSESLRWNLLRLSEILDGFDILYKQHSGDIQSNKLYTDAKNKLLRLSEKNRLSTIDSVLLLNKLGKFCYKLRIYANTEQYFEKAIDKYLSLSAAEQSESYEFDKITASIDLLDVYQKEMGTTTGNSSFKNKAVTLLKNAEQWNEKDPDSYNHDYNKARLIEFDAAFKNGNSESIIPGDYLDDIENKLNGLLTNNKDTLNMVPHLEKIINELEVSYKKNSHNEKLNSLLSNAYGSVSWYYIFRKQFLKTLESAKRGLAIDSTQTWIYSNLAIGYLSQGKLHETEEIYAKYKDLGFDDQRSFKDAFIDDLHTLREANIIFPNMREAEDFLLR